jgi:hypothetical protein
VSDKKFRQLYSVKLQVLPVTIHHSGREIFYETIQPLTNAHRNGDVTPVLRIATANLTTTVIAFITADDFYPAHSAVLITTFVVTTI